VDTKVNHSSVYLFSIRLQKQRSNHGGSRKGDNIAREWTEGGRGVGWRATYYLYEAEE
jgi:hypothetical protein